MLFRSIFSLFVLIGVSTDAYANELIDMTVGHSKVIRIAGVPATVIIGDEGIADATMGSGGTIILTAHALGSTNMILLDEAGSRISNSTLQVGPLDRRPKSTIRISRGNSNPQEYVCGKGSGCAPKNGANAAAASLVGALGPCMRSGDFAADGSRCGGRAASVRPGGIDGEGQPEHRP